MGEKERVKKEKSRREQARDGEEEEKKGNSLAFHASLSQRLLQPLDLLTVRCAARKMDVIAHENPHFSADHSQPLKVRRFTAA